MSDRRPNGQRTIDWWIAVVRLGAVPFGLLQIPLTSGFPGHGELWAWLLLACFGAGALPLLMFARNGLSNRVALAALVFDFGIATAYAALYAFEFGSPIRQLLLLVVLEGATRFGTRGGLWTALSAGPAVAIYEWRRGDYFHVPFRFEYVTFQTGIGLLAGLLVGKLVAQLEHEHGAAHQRAAEAEVLRDELGRRADTLEAAARCARALSSSLDMNEASEAFVRELRGLIPFRRMAIILAEGDAARVLTTAGERADEVYPPGSTLSLDDNILVEVVGNGRLVYREDMSEPLYAEEAQLVELGLRSRALAPLLVGTQGIGAISVGREEPHAFHPHELELLSLLGRVAGSAIQNIRAYEGERRTVEELRRLSGLRADFVSLVSHELRSPMAAVIGAARTLEQRWRELKPEQRESFLRLIGDETDRLARLVEDVLDTSRIEAGSFAYRFAEVDLAALLRDSVSASALIQDEVPIVADVPATLPTIRGDAERLRQVLGNLVDNAVKYSPAGSPVFVRAAGRDRRVDVTVTDSGPGIAVADRELVFEKFGRVPGSGQKPGTGLGLFIARSIIEAHGGTVSVSSPPGQGASFTLSLPAL